MPCARTTRGLWIPYVERRSSYLARAVGLGAGAGARGGARGPRRGSRHAGRGAVSGILSSRARGARRARGPAAPGRGRRDTRTHTHFQTPNPIAKNTVQYQTNAPKWPACASRLPYSSLATTSNKRAHSSSPGRAPSTLLAVASHRHTTGRATDAARPPGRRWSPATRPPPRRDRTRKPGWS